MCYCSGELAGVYLRSAEVHKASLQFFSHQV